MHNFMIAYSGGSQPSSQEPDTAQMSKWKAWVDGLGDAVVNPGTALPISKIVTSRSVEDDNDPNAIKGVAVIKAESMEAAIKIVQSDLCFENGGRIRIAQMMEMK